MQGLQAIEDDVKGAGGAIFLIGPETEANALEMMDKTQARIPILHDTDGRVMQAYRLAFDAPPEYQALYREMGHPLVEANPRTGFRLPIPATFIVGRDRRIRARFVHADYTRRMEPADVLAAVRRIETSHSA